MKALFTSDIHLSSRPRDEYRWNIFPWLRTQALNRQVSDIFLLGDLTDLKDNHSNLFLNRIVDSLRELQSATGADLHLLKGNHDFSDPEAPLLRFLAEAPLRFYPRPESIRTKSGARVLLLPNSRSPDSEWKKLEFSGYDFVLLHQTFDGAEAENGTKMQSALQATRFRDIESVFISGDIHVPQRVGPVVYCGSPHPIRFGDSFQPRVLYWNGEELRSIKRVTLRKAILEVRSLAELKKTDLTEGDQVKVIFELPRSRFGEWADVRQEVERLASSLGWILASVELREAGSMTNKKLREAAPSSRVEPKELLTLFCEANKIPATVAKAGFRLIS